MTDTTEPTIITSQVPIEHWHEHIGKPPLPMLRRIGLCTVHTASDLKPRTRQNPAAKAKLDETAVQ